MPSFQKNGKGKEEDSSTFMRRREYEPLILQLIMVSHDAK